MTLQQRIQEFINYTPAPRNPAVDRFLYLIGILGTTAELIFAFLKGEMEPIGVALRIVILSYSIGAVIFSYRSTWGKSNAPLMTFFWLLIVLVQLSYQNNIHDYRFDFAVIMFMVFPTGAMFVASPKWAIAYVISGVAILMGAILLSDQPLEFQLRVSLLIFYMTLASIAVFFINFRLGKQLQGASEKFRVLAEYSSDIISMHDVQGVLKYVSPSGTRQTGYSQDELIGKSAFEMIHPSDRDRAKEIYKQIFMPPHQPVQLEYRLLRKNGSILWVEAIGTPVLNEENKITQVVTATRDISKRKKAENERELKSAELQRINRELDQFAYVVSHDLKAPLRGISSLADFIEEDLGEKDLSPEVRKHLLLMRQRAERLERLINDILAYSRAGRTQTASEWVDTGKFFHDLVDLLAIPKNFNVEFKGEFPVMDATKIYLEQVFSNLISNACKHHDQPEGNITIAVEEVPGGWQFSVSDDGPGIESKHHERIFEVFSQLSPKDATHGTGIGLAIVRKILEKIHGTITVKPNQPRGTTFVVFWPEKLKK